MKIRPHLASAAVATIVGVLALATSTEASAAPEAGAPESSQHRSAKGPAFAAHLPAADGTTIITFEEFEESISESLQPYSEYPPQAGLHNPQVFTFGSS